MHVLGHELNGLMRVIILAVFFVTGRSFKYSWKNCKTSVYRSFKSIFGRIGRFASAEVIIQLLQSKCMPVLLYGLEACPINFSDYRWSEHPVAMAFMKVFKTNYVIGSTNVKRPFGFDTVCRQIIKRIKKTVK